MTNTGDGSNGLNHDQTVDARAEKAYAALGKAIDQLTAALRSTAFQIIDEAFRKDDGA